MQARARRLSVLAIFALAIAFPVFGGTGYEDGGGGSHHTPPILVGSWVGHLSGNLHGTVTLNINQAGDSGTFLGSTLTEIEGSSDVDGTFTQSGRKLVGSVTMQGGIVGTYPFTGKSNWKASRMKWKIVLADGSKAIVHVEPVNPTR